MLLLGEAFQDIFEKSRVPLSIASAREPDFPLVAVNALFEDLTGYASAEVIGKNCRFLSRKEPGGPVTAILREGLASKKGVTQTLTNFKKSGEEFLNFVTILPLHGLNGVVEYFVGSHIDVTRTTELAQRSVHLGDDALVSSKLVQDALQSSLHSATVYTKSLQLLLQMKINERFESAAVKSAAQIMRIPESDAQKSAISSGKVGQGDPR